MRSLQTSDPNATEDQGHVQPTLAIRSDLLMEESVVLEVLVAEVVLHLLPNCFTVDSAGALTNDYILHGFADDVICDPRYEVQTGFLLDVVIRQGTLILEQPAAEGQSMLGAVLVKDIGLDIGSMDRKPSHSQ